MARYNGLIIPRSYNDYYSRSDPQAIRDIVALAADGELNAESKNPLQNQAIAKIVPNTASETNKLADKNFVNSTVGTNTANYIYKTESGGEKVPFSSVAELEAYAGTVTNNDYAFVTGIDENGNTYYDRYKADVNDGVVTWAKEYRLNNSSFTAEQWAAIQSGITAEKVAQFEGAVAPVDVVQSGNMSAVTSNAVYEALTDAATIQQALQVPGVLSGAVAAGDNKAVTSDAVNSALTNLLNNPINLAFNTRIGSIRFLDLDVVSEDSVCETILSSAKYNSINYLGIKSIGLSEMIIGSEYMIDEGYKVGVQLKLRGTDAEAVPSIRVRKCNGGWSTWNALV